MAPGPRRRRRRDAAGRTTCSPACSSRSTSALAARSRFSLERFSDVYIVTRAVFKHVRDAASSSRVSFSLTARDQRLELTIGPLGIGTRRTAAGDRIRPPSSDPSVAELADELAFETTRPLRAVARGADRPRAGFERNAGPAVAAPAMRRAATRRPRPRPRPRRLVGVVPPVPSSSSSSESSSSSRAAHPAPSGQSASAPNPGRRPRCAARPRRCGARGRRPLRRGDPRVLWRLCPSWSRRYPSRASRTRGASRRASEALSGAP